jgi:hypothetical protein
MVDIQYRAQGSVDPERPCLTLCHVRMRDPGPDGSGTREDTQRIDLLFENAEPGLEAVGAVFVARTRDGGYMSFAVYSSKQNEPKIEQVLRRVFGDEASFERSHDPGWETYRSLLPGLEDERGALDFHVIQKLQELGDPLTPERDIQHLAYFPAEAGAASYADDLKRQGFAVELGSTPGEALPYWVTAARDGSVTPEAITPVSIALAQGAAARGGMYDGWQARLVRAGEGPRSKPGLLSRLFGRKQG